MGTSVAAFPVGHASGALLGNVGTDAPGASPDLPQTQSRRKIHESEVEVGSGLGGPDIARIGEEEVVEEEASNPLAPQMMISAWEMQFYAEGFRIPFQSIHSKPNRPGFPALGPPARASSGGALP